MYPARKLPPLSPRQREFVSTVERLTRQMGYGPSLREIAQAMGCHLTRARETGILAARKGAISHTPAIARSWRVVKHPRSAG